MADEPAVDGYACRCGRETEEGYMECGAKVRWLPLDADLDRVTARMPLSMVQPALIDARRCQACRLILITY